MMFKYGKHDVRTIERGEEVCCLLTNGLGGFSSCTMAGSNARNDHALLMACIKAPNHRYCMVSRLSEQLFTGGRSCWISSQRLADGREEDGYLQMTSFSFEDVPQWRYGYNGTEIVKTVGMLYGSNTVGVSYRIHNFGKDEITFAVTPYFQMVKKGEEFSGEQELQLEDGAVYKDGYYVYFTTNGITEEIKPVCETQYYAYDECDGRRACGRACANHMINLTVPGDCEKEFELIYSTETDIMRSGITAAHIIKESKKRRRQLVEKSGFHMPAARMLVKSADQFIAKRASTGGDTILAGYPFFEDWGRDTMIALPGCVLSAGQYDTAKSILRTFMANEKKGLMPNLFPEGENEPVYNTVDAALLFINCVYLYYEKTGDLDFAGEAFPVMERIISWYCKGTDYGIHVEEDGLLSAGEKLDQVTWMDVRIGDILPTPRHGKPVEINAYWYNALRIMELFEKRLIENGLYDMKLSAAGICYGSMAEQTKNSFIKQFWMEDVSCLKDVVSGTKADCQIRCNQIWAVSMPFTMLTGEQEKRVVQTVYEKLYTPYGLRTLDPADREFHPHYGGPQLARDMAYHQGTVWTFPLGAYYLAYLKVHGYTREAAFVVVQQLEVMECALREGCSGQLPEIYDGACPASSKGCFAQAWSVGEILRVYEALEQFGDWSEEYGA